MNDLPPLLKSQMLQRSLRCYALGWWGLVPVFGLVPALLAFAEFRAVVLRKGGQWNAARPQLLLGAWLAGVGVFLSLTIVVIVCVAIAETW